MAEEPFWPERNGSASSPTSVRCPCLTSSATASHTVAARARALTPPGIPPLALEGRVDFGLAPPRPGKGPPRDRLPRAHQPVPAAGHGEGEVGDPVPPD